MDWQKRLDEAARRAARAVDPDARDALALLIAVVDEIAREALPREAEIE